MEKRYFFVEERSGGRVYAQFLGYMTEEEAENYDVSELRDPLNPAWWVMSDEEISNAGYCDGYLLDHIEEIGEGYIKE